MARNDMFLKVTGARTGAISGESKDKSFTGQIDISSWKWGMTAPTAVGGARTARVQVRELMVVKNADKASTGLMSAMRGNETLSVVISVRKAAGTSPLVYMVATVDQARLTSYEIEPGINAAGAPILVERLSMSYKTITFDYTPQDDTGKPLGATSFSADAAAPE